MTITIFNYTLIYFRKSETDDNLWSRLNFEIKVVFLIGSKSSESLNDEIEKYGDILILDFAESHYRLPAKDFHFLQFIEENCPGTFDMFILGLNNIIIIIINL